jgi:LacI family transcriptional regulator
MTQKRHTITIRDIAEKANVSYQTVSLVLNNKRGVSEPTRKRILSLMADMGYQPNRAAQMLAANRSHTLETIVVDVRYGGYLAGSTKNMVQTAKQAGYTLLVSETDSAGLAAALSNAAARRVEGVVLYAPRLKLPDDELLRISAGLPLVRRDYSPSSNLPWVGFDQTQATRIALEHLLELGHTRIAAIPPAADLINGYWRTATFRSFLREHGCEPGPSIDGDYSIASGYNAAHRLLDTGDPFTAIMVGTDTMAVGVLAALRERGVRVPDDISLVSFDNSEMAPYLEVPLTTIEFRFAKQDEMAVRYLIELVDNPETDIHHRVLTSSLIVRRSTRRLE